MKFNPYDGGGGGGKVAFPQSFGMVYPGKGCGFWKMHWVPDEDGGASCNDGGWGWSCGKGNDGCMNFGNGQVLKGGGDQYSCPSGDAWKGKGGWEPSVDGTSGSGESWEGGGQADWSDCGNGGDGGYWSGCGDGGDGGRDAAVDEGGDQHWTTHDQWGGEGQEAVAESGDGADAHAGVGEDFVWEGVCEETQAADSGNSETGAF